MLGAPVASRIFSDTSAASWLAENTLRGDAASPIFVDHRPHACSLKVLREPKL
jgi:hypothetical protein